MERRASPPRRHGITTTRRRSLVAAGLRAQSPEKPLAFEVASVRPNNSGASPSMTRLLPGGRAEAKNLPLNILIRIVYASDDVQTLDQIVGGPSWVRADRWDIVAKAVGDPGYDSSGRPIRLAEMLKTLLEDRFQLKVHTEMRQTAVYALVAVTAGRLGPNLMPSPITDCPPVPSRGSAAAPYSLPPCATSNANGKLAGKAIPMTQLATTLASVPVIGRPAISSAAYLENRGNDFTAFTTRRSTPRHQTAAAGPDHILRECGRLDA